MTAAVRPCNFCGSAEARLRLHGYGFDRSDERFDVYECPACGLVRVEPPPADLARYYAPEYYGSREAKFTGPLEALVRRANERRVRALLRWLPPGGSRCVLDVGCGRGLFLRALHAHGFVAVGTELPGFDFPPGHAGVHFFHAPAEALPFADAAFDAVSIWHVLEHTTDPAAALRAAARVLRPGGVLALAVPNFGSRQARWFGRHWFHLDLPRHLYHFRLAPLTRRLEQEGLTVLDVGTLSWDQNVYGFVQSCLNVVLWRTAPNGLYQLLKRHGGAGAKARLLGHLLLGAALAPAAVAETLLSAWQAQGATLILYARKQGSALPPA